jgi:hypothetical protein
MDADDSMTSTTPSSGDAALDDDSLFPGSKNPPSTGTSVRPQTPQNDHLNAAAPGELSPPRSQTHEPRSSSFTNGTYADVIGTSSTGPAAAADKPITDQPGMGWKNKKAQEEMQRAWEFVVDRDFTLREFGDVIMQGKQQRGDA